MMRIKIIKKLLHEKNVSKGEGAYPSRRQEGWSSEVGQDAGCMLQVPFALGKPAYNHISHLISGGGGCSDWW